MNLPTQESGSAADNDFVGEMSTTLIRHGYRPHTKPVPMTTKLEVWWEEPSKTTINWPTTLLLISFMIFVLLMVKGYPVL